MTATVLMAAICALIGASMGVSGIGGFLIVPAMLLVLGSSPAEAVVAALLANLAGTLTTGVLAVRRGQVLWRAFSWLTLGGVLAALAGFRLAHFLAGEFARMVIALFLLAAAVAVLLRGPTPQSEPRVRAVATVATGAFAQLSAFLAGIGGPAVTVPVLAAGGHHQLLAIGTGLLHGIVVSSTAVVITLLAHTEAILNRETLFFPAIVVSVMFATNLFRERFASSELIRLTVGVASLIGGLFTLLNR